MGAVVSRREKLAEWIPKEPGFFVELAYATRRAESIHAHAVLTRAAGLHPNDATIQFNLACYEAQSAAVPARCGHHPVDRTSIEASSAARRTAILAILRLGVGPAPLFQLGV